MKNKQHIFIFCTVVVALTAAFASSPKSDTKRADLVSDLNLKSNATDTDVVNKLIDLLGKPPVKSTAFLGITKDFSDVVAKVHPSTVEVISLHAASSAMNVFGGSPLGGIFNENEMLRKFFEHMQPKNKESDQKEERPGAMGSGFVIDSKGHIVTNHHVIDGASAVKVKLFGSDDMHEAEIIGADPKTDLAVLKLKDKIKVSPVVWGDSDKVRVGEWAIAIGNPLNVGNSVTAGIVSAKSRELAIRGHVDFIQIDAPINRGNSGGPVFDAAGRLIGISNIIASTNGGSQGIGFAIPSNTAKDVVDQLVNKGEVKRGRIGVAVADAKPETTESLGLTEKGGALIHRVEENSPAQKAGLKSGDVVVEFNNHPIKSMRQLMQVTAKIDIGAEASIKVWRSTGPKKGKYVTSQVKVEDLGDGENADGSSQKTLVLNKLGCEIANITPSVRRQYKLNDKIDGVVIAKVHPKSLSQMYRLSEGMVITALNKDPVKNLKQVEKVMKDHKDSKVLNVDIVTPSGSSMFISVY
jgi:serine protease Do